jgi:hypothetical protein
MVKNKPNRPLNQSFQQGCVRLRYTTDTGFKVVHVGGKSVADKSVITAADVNNFAAATWTVVNNWRFKTQSDGLTQLWVSTVLHNPPSEGFQKSTDWPKARRREV